MIVRPILACVVAIIFAAPASAKELRVMSWNVSGGEQSPAELESNARALVEQLGPVDIAVIDEVIESDQVEAIANGLELDHWVISDFSPPVAREMIEDLRQRLNRLEGLLRD